MSLKAEEIWGHIVKLDNERWRVLKKGPQSAEPERGKDETSLCWVIF